MQKKTQPILKLAITSALIAASHSALSQQVNDPDVEEIVVSATRTLRHIDDVVNSVSIISELEIENSPALSVDELLEGVAGVDVKHPSGVLSTSTSNSVALRGMAGENRTLVLLDGIPLNDVYNGSVEWNAVSAHDVQRIEIVRGATSAIYGSNAMGGVINIITKKPDKNWKSRVGVSTGTYSTNQLNLSTSGTIGDLGIRLSAGTLDSDGYQSLPAAKVSSTTIAQGVERSTIRAQLAYDLSENDELALSVDHFDESKTGTNSVSDFRPYDQDKTSGNLSYTRKLGSDKQLFISAFVDRYNSLYDSLNTARTTKNFVSNGDLESQGISAQFSQPFSAGSIRHYVTTGIELRDATIERTDSYVSGRQIYVAGSQIYTGAYLQDEIFVGSKWIFNLGARIDRWKNSDGSSTDTSAKPANLSYPKSDADSFNPKVGFVYKLNENSSLRGSAGTAFRAPTLSDLYRTSIIVSTIYAGNANLVAEDVNAYEFGYDLRLLSGSRLSITAYQNDAENYIGFVTPNPAITTYRLKQNIGEVQSKGFEVSYDIVIDEKWHASAAYTSNRSRIVSNPPDVRLEGNYVPDSPKEKGSISLSYSDLNSFDVNAIVTYVGEQFTSDTNTASYDSYTQVDLSIAKEITPNLRLSLEVSDLLDDRFTTTDVSPGRILYGKVQLEL